MSQDSEEKKERKKRQISEEEERIGIFSKEKEKEEKEKEKEKKEREKKLEKKEKEKKEKEKEGKEIKENYYNFHLRKSESEDDLCFLDDGNASGQPIGFLDFSLDSLSRQTDSFSLSSPGKKNCTNKVAQENEEVDVVHVDQGCGDGGEAKGFIELNHHLVALENDEFIQLDVGVARGSPEGFLHHREEDVSGLVGDAQGFLHFHPHPPQPPRQEQQQSPLNQDIHQQQQQELRLSPLSYNKKKSKSKRKGSQKSPHSSPQSPLQKGPKLPRHSISFSSSSSSSFSSSSTQKGSAVKRAQTVIKSPSQSKSQWNSSLSLSSASQSQITRVPAGSFASKKVSSPKKERKLTGMTINFRRKRTHVSAENRFQSLLQSQPTDDLLIFSKEEGIEILSDCACQINMAIKFQVNQILTKIDPLDSLRNISGIERAFREHLVPYLTSAPLKKNQPLAIFHYIYDITLEISNSPLPKLFDERDDDQLFDDLSEAWCEIAKKTWSQNRWVEIFHLTGRALRMGFVSAEIKILKGMLSKLASCLQNRTFKGKGRIEQIVFDGIEYLDIHSTDASNLFIGVAPSLALEKKFNPLSDKLTIREDVGDDSLHSIFGQEMEEYQQESNFILSSSLEMLPLRFLSRWGSMKGHPERILLEIQQIQEALKFKALHLMRGELVGVQVESIPLEFRSWYEMHSDDSPFILGRIAGGSSKSPSLVQIFIDCFESLKIEVPITHVFSIGSWENQKNPLQNLRTCRNSGLFRNPLASLFSLCIDFIEREVSNLIQQKGVTIVNTEDSSQMPLLQIERVFSELKIVETLRDDPNLIFQFMEQKIPLLTTELLKWTKEIAEGHLVPCLDESLVEITRFLTSIKTLIWQEVYHHVATKMNLLNQLKRRIWSVLKGERKTEVCGWWLSYIEEKVNEYLKECGYNFEATADDYIREPPRDLDQVTENLAIIQEELQPNNEPLDLFVEQTTEEVYVKLDVLSSELDYVCFGRWQELPLKWGNTEKEREMLEQDLSYLRRVKRMDEEIKRRRLEGEIQGKPAEMTDVVPVSGLIMARFHILETETQTALEIWGKKVTPDISMTETSPPTFDLLRLKNFGLDRGSEQETRGFFQISESHLSEMEGFDEVLEEIEGKEVSRARDFLVHFQSIEEVNSHSPATSPTSPLQERISIEPPYQKKKAHSLSPLSSPRLGIRPHSPAPLPLLSFGESPLRGKMRVGRKSGKKKDPSKVKKKKSD